MSIEIDKRVNHVKGGWLVFTHALYRFREPLLIEEEAPKWPTRYYVTALVLAFLLFGIFCEVCR